MTREEVIAELETRYLTMSQCANKAECRRANEALDMAIEALKQEPKSEWQQDHEILRAYSDGAENVLDKIRAEIEDWQTDIHDNEHDADKYDFVFEQIFEIIDKYKAESEDKE